VAAALRVTLRCLADDLGLEPDDEWPSVRKLADGSSVIRAFVDKRSQSSEGQETIEGLASPIVAYSLHAGSDRGITWHDRDIDVVWLLAARFHRSGKRDDAYPYFRSLDQAGRLMPSREDYIAHLASETQHLAQRLAAEIPPIRNAARQSPRTIQEAILADRIRVRVVYEDDDPPMMTVAISQDLLPGEVSVPPEWQLVVAAGFLPFTTPPSDLSFTFDLAGAPLRHDEVVYCDFAHQW